MPCKEYEQMEIVQKRERNMWADFTYHENPQLRSRIGAQ
jgi:hypothetical protein